MRNIRVLTILLTILILSSSANAEFLSGIVFESSYPVEEFSRGDVSQFVMIENGLIVLDTQNEYISFGDIMGGAPKYQSSVIVSENEKLCIWGITKSDNKLLAMEASFTEESGRKYHEVALYEIPPQTEGDFEQEKIAPLNWFDICKDDEQIESMAVVSSTLIVITDKKRAIVFDLSSGNGTAVTEENYIDVLLMDDSNVILIQEKGEYNQLSMYNTNLHEITALKAIDVSTTGFATKDGSIYYCDRYRLFKTDFTEELVQPEFVTNLSVESGEKALISGNTYLLGTKDTIRAFDMNTVNEKKVVIYYDIMNSSMLDSFAQENSDIQLIVEKTRGRDSILTDLLTRDNTVDVYVLSTAMTPAFKTIRNRGYAMEIMEEDIQKYISQLYPQIQSEVMVDGKIHGIPIAMQVQICALGVNLEAWEALGMAKDELPQTWEELMSFITEEWPIMQDNASDMGICLMYQGDFETLPTVFVNNRMSQKPEMGEPVYTTPDMINNYDRYQEALLQELYAPNDFDGQALFSIFEITPGINMYSMYDLLPLTLDGKMTYPMSTMEVMVINPYTERRDVALMLIEHCIRNINPRDAVMMMPGNNAPIERTDYSKSLLQLQEKITMYDSRIAAAQSDVEKRNLKADKMRIIQEDMEYLESTRWVISEADIQEYRDIIEGFAIEYAFTTEESETRKLNDLYERFNSGSIDAQTYASGLDQALLMSEMEDE